MIKNTILSIVACFVLCSCSSCASHKAFPTNNENEIRWKQEYRDGKLSYSEYKSLKDGEKANQKN